MALEVEFEKQGNFLFKNRSHIPLIFVFAGFAYIYVYGLNRPVENMYLWIGICTLPILLGQYIRAYAIGFSGNKTSGRNTSAGQVAESINKTGMYSMVRHPLYLGNYFMWLGTLMFVGSWEFVVMCSFGYWFYYERIMYAEEQFLRGKFGKEQYDEWSANTPAIFPKFKNFKSSQYNVFDWKDTLRREYLGLCASFFVMSFYGIFYFSVENQTLTWSEEVKWMFYGNLGFFLIVRLLSKKTKWLQPLRLEA